MVKSSSRAGKNGIGIDTFGIGFDVELELTKWN